MPIHKEPNGSFRVDVQYKGKRGRARFSSMADAQAAEQIILGNLMAGREALDGVPGAEARQEKARQIKSALVPATFGDLVDFTHRRRWADLKDSTGPHTQAKIMAAIVGEKLPLARFTVEHVDQIVDGLKARGVAEATINRYLSALSTMLKLAEERGYIAKRPTIPFYDEDEGRIRWLSFEEERTLLAHMRGFGEGNAQDVADFVEIAVDTGFRRGELLAFDVKDWDGKRLYLWGKDGATGGTKAGNSRSVVATPRVNSIIAKRVKAGYTGRLFDGLKEHTLRWFWDRAKAEMGLAGDDAFVLHACRHTCATRLVGANVNLRVVQVWMGHKDIKTTLRYAHVSDALVEDAAYRLASLWQTGTHSDVAPIELGHCDATCDANLGVRDAA